MKKLTKKFVKESATFVAIIDYKAGKGPVRGFDFIELSAKNILEAMNEAGKLMTEDVYLIKIAEKAGVYNIGEYSEIGRIIYRSVLVCRSFGWYPSTEENGEQATLIEHDYFYYQGKELTELGFDWCDKYIQDNYEAI